MKRRLNILCVFVILLLLIPVLQSTYYVGIGLKIGMESGKEKRMNTLSKLYDLREISLIPDDFLVLQDSVMNEKTGENVPAIYTRMGVVLPLKDQSPWLVYISVLSTYVYMFAALASIVLFIIIIVSVNKSNIFIWTNVSRLRWLGSTLILTFVGGALPHLLLYASITKEFSIPGYSLSLNELISFLTLALALIAYIFAEIFAIGLRMKEEQDLTI